MSKKKWKEVPLKIKAVAIVGMIVAMPILLIWYIIENTVRQTYRFARAMWYENKKETPEDIDELEIAKNLRLDDAEEWESEELK